MPNSRLRQNLQAAHSTAGGTLGANQVIGPSSALIAEALAKGEDRSRGHGRFARIATDQRERGAQALHNLYRNGAHCYESPAPRTETSHT